MRRIPRFAILVTVLLAGGAQGTSAQVGAILDWISRLSGPGIVRGGVEWAIPVTADEAVSITPAVMVGGKVRDGDGPDGDASLTMYSGQLTADVVLAGRAGPTAFLVSAGVAGHRFTGSDFDNFNAFSVPAFVMLRQSLGARGHQIRLGVGMNVFRFGDTAFDPIDVGVEQGKWEASFGINMAFLLKF